MGYQKLPVQQKDNIGQGYSAKKTVESDKAHEARFQTPLHHFVAGSSSPPSIPPSPHNILHLQQTIGNQAVGRLIQSKLKIGRPGDKYEQEADQVADAVMRMPEPQVLRQAEEEEEEELIQTKPIAEQITPLVQRQAEEEEEVEKIPPKPVSGQITPIIQRQDEEEEEEIEEEPIQPKSFSEQVAPLVQRQVEEEEKEEIQPKALAEKITPLVQRQDEEETEETIQPKLLSPSQLTIQKQEEPEEEEEALQTKSSDGQITPFIQRQVQLEEEEEEEPIQTKLELDTQLQSQEEEPEEEEKEPVQTKGTSGRTTNATPKLKSRINSIKAGGQPLPKSVCAFFQPRFGQDFSRVRVHSDAQGAESAKLLNARAFAVGRDIVFGAGQYSPDTTAGKKLLAHELTHVVQQSESLFKSRPVIQRWGPGVHEELTEKGVKKIFSGYPRFKMNREALRKVGSYSTEMDFKFFEILFNVRAELAGETYEAVGPLVGGGHPPSKEITRERSLKAYRRLVAHYRKNPEHAKNHGEGGLYYMSKSDAAAVNESHQGQYEIEARREFNRLDWEFLSEKECRETKSEARQVVLKELGDALHIAQDRGAHGEGAVWQGHGKEIFEPGFDPDNKGRNLRGYEEAQENTDEVLLHASDFLYDIFENVCRWTSYKGPVEVRKINRCNQAVQRLIKSGVIQTNVNINEPKDIYGKQIEQSVETIKRNPSPQGHRQIGKESFIPSKPFAETMSPLVQRRAKREIIPKLEDCRDKMKNNLPKAHRRAIELTSRAIKFYEEVFSIVRSGLSLERIHKKLGDRRSNFLSIFWRIYINPEMRKLKAEKELKGLSIKISKLQIDLEILYPISQILKTYRKIKAGLQKSDFNYECEYRDRWWYQGCKEGETKAWVLASGIGDIHICVDELNDLDDIDEIASTIIHEASHKFGKTSDEAVAAFLNAHSYDTSINQIPE